MITITATTTTSDDLHARNFSDLHKDAYGFRPRGAIWEAWLAMTPAELDSEEARMQRDVETAIEEELANEAANAVSFEAHIGKLMADFSIDRATAIRWDLQALDLTDDIKFYGLDLYRHEYGLGYDYDLHFSL